MWRSMITIFFGLPISIVDFKSRRIPNNLLIAMFFSLEVSLLFFANSLFFSRNVQVLCLTSLAIILAATSQEFIGMGDVKLLIVIILVTKSFQQWLNIVILAIAIGLIWAGLSRNRSIPFAPSIFMAMLILI